MFALVRLAARNVVRNRRRSLISLSAIFVALTVMVTVRGLLNGLHGAIREEVVQGQLGPIQIHKKGFFASTQGPGLDFDIPADDATLGRIAAVPGVTGVAPRIPFGGMVNFGDSTVFAIFQGLDPRREITVCPRRYDRVDGGQRLSEAHPKGGDFTAAVARRLGAKLGDTVAILGPDRDGVLNAVEVPIQGTMAQAAVVGAESKLAYLPLGVAQELLRMPGRATEIAVGIKQLDQVEEVAARVAVTVGDAYEVHTWHHYAKFLDEVIQNQNMVLNFISYIFLFMALLGILNTMMMSVRERTREIGTMMAVGVRRRQILGLFLLEAALIGLAGGSLGVLVGGGLVTYWGRGGLEIRMTGGEAIIQLFPYITVRFILSVFSLAGLGAAVAALLPSYFASRLRPVEALASH